MTSTASIATFVLVDSEDILQSIGAHEFLNDHLTPMGDTDVKVEVTHIPAVRCDIIARRVEGGQGGNRDVPRGLETWYHDMTDPIAIDATTSLFVVSLADTVNAEVFRDRTSGVLVQPPIGYRSLWAEDATEWLDQNFQPEPPSVESITQSLRDIALHLEPSGADLVVYNTSTFVPHEKVYWFSEGAQDTTSVRAARMNLVADSLLKELDITLVDVDRITAEIGARQSVVAPALYTPETFEALAQEAIAMILDLEGISRLFSSDMMQLNVPRFDRRTARATLMRWHVAAGMQIDKGDLLFDLRFGNVRSRLNDHGRDTDRAIDMSVVAGRAGFVDSISVDSGEQVDVGTRVAIITAHRESTWRDMDNAARFPVGVRVLGRDDR